MDAWFICKLGALKEAKRGIEDDALAKISETRRGWFKGLRR